MFFQEQILEATLLVCRDDFSPDAKAGKCKWKTIKYQDISIYAERAYRRYLFQYLHLTRSNQIYEKIRPDLPW